MAIKPPIVTPKLFDPVEVMEKIKLEEGMHVADLGCGSGYISFEAAKLVGDSGKVYAIDVQKAVLSALRSKIKLYGLYQVKPVWADLEVPGSTRIKDGTVDMSILATVLYQTRDHIPMFKEAYRITKKDGKLFILEWKKVDIALGPVVKLRLDKDEAKKLAENAGFKFIKNVNVGEYHYGMLFEK